MKEKLEKLILDTVMSWSENDIYAISLFVCDDNDNPCKPTVTLGYNTELKVKQELPEAEDENEARWNYAFWLQNEEFCFGTNETASDVRKWIEDKGFSYYEDDSPVWEDDAAYNEAEEITKAFISELTHIVADIHKSEILTAKFGKEIPILIHELEYYDEIAKQNIEANGEELVKEFVRYCMEG